MSKGFKPRGEYVQTLSVEQLRDFYVNADPRAKSKNARAGRAPRKTYASPPTVRGRGEYTTTPSSKPSKKYGSVPNAPKGANFKSDYGSRLGSVLGEGIQSFANVLGFGEYNIQSNSMLSEKYIDTGASPPRVKNTNKGEATVFSHREYLGELLTGTGTPSAFTLQQYAINPGNSLLFPLTSGIARHFQEWEVRGMLVELKSEASNTATSLSLGSMFCAVDYNSLDPAPLNKTELENLEYACSNKPTCSILMPIECARANSVMTHMYVVTDDQLPGGDPRLSDLGNLFIGSYGCPEAGVPIAEIWVTYEIAFFKPHIPHVQIAPVVDYGLGAHFWGSWVWEEGIPPLSGLTSQSVNSSLGSLIVPEGDAHVIHFPRSDQERWYLVTCTWRTQGTISSPQIPTVVPVPSSGGVIVLENVYSGIAGNHAQTYASSVNANSVVMQIMVSVPPHQNDNFNSLGVLGGTLGVSGSTTFWDCLLAEVPKNGVL